MNDRIRVARCRSGAGRAVIHDCGGWRVFVGDLRDRLCKTWDGAMERACEIAKGSAS